MNCHIIMNGVVALWLEKSILLLFIRSLDVHRALFRCTHPAALFTLHLTVACQQTAIEELQEANQDVTEKSLVLHDLLKQPNSAKQAIATARSELDTALNTLAEKSEAAKKRVEAITDQKVDHNL